ncbi:MAG: esterase-like activity of phytase family protein [Alphaproteobacteria bacterium]|nr:MAG: esterase-like activity of phytase family protein [Alphaproteobacteria bacterium]
MRFRLALTLALLGLVGPATRAEPTMPARLVSALTWSLPDPDFGGWSGLEVSDDGREFTAISDRGTIISGTLERDGAGRLAGVDAGPVVPILHSDGGRLPRFYNDSEGLAIAPDGRVFISFEAVHRVVEYPGPGVTPTRTLPIYAPFRKMRNNASLEALAIGPDGSLYTVPEVSGRAGRPFPVYRFANGAWSHFAFIPRPDDFRIVGADIGPDNRFYLLERQFSGLFGFATRVRRFDITPTGLRFNETLFQSATGTHDNLEGLAVWRDADGHIRLTMVSDDNFNFFQRTEIVEYVVTE